jgi:hypothetical protein
MLVAQLWIMKDGICRFLCFVSKLEVGDRMHFCSLKMQLGHKGGSIMVDLLVTT